MKEVICSLGDNLEAVEAATHYRGVAVSPGVHRITERIRCAVCEKTVEVGYGKSSFASFYSRHIQCHEDYFKENGRPPRGVGAVEVASKASTMIVFARPSEVMRMARQLSREHGGRIGRSWNCSGRPADVSFGSAFFVSPIEDL